MRCSILTTAIAFSALGLIGCGSGGSGIASSGSYNPGYGPFDANGNYVEEWADKPAKKHWWAGKSKAATAQQPAKPTPQPPAIASTTRRAETRTARPSRPTEVARLDRTRTVSRSAVPTYTPPAPKPRPPAVASTPPPPKPAAKPTPKPTPVKPKAPAPIRHTVKAGDTLYSLSRRYGTTVPAIQRANGIKGTTIITGKTYLIPR